MMRRFIMLACAAAFALPVEAASPFLNEGGKARRYETDRIQLVDGSLLRTTGTAHPVHEIEVVAKKFAFEPETIGVGSGEAVRLAIRSADSTHGFAILPSRSTRRSRKAALPSASSSSRRRPAATRLRGRNSAAWGTAA
jgi:plastocyanin